MLYIHYNQTKPNETEFEYAIQGDNNVDVVDFDISDIRLDFEPAHTYVKVQSKDKKYIDKIELAANNSHLLWNLQAKTTRHKIVNVQLSFETEQKCFQTEMVELTLKPYINADQTIENDYPTVLQDLQDQIDELKQQGGGGASSVEIERVYLTYDDKKSIRSDYLGLMDIRANKRFVNDSTRIWVNFKTTPINAQMEQEIKNGRFVIRLDYPLRNRTSMLKIWNDRDNFIKQSVSTKKYGVGARGFVRSFSEGFNESAVSQLRKNVLLKSLIFVNEDDIKTNDYGERYIDKKIRLIDYINKTTQMIFINRDGETHVEPQPITNDWVNNNEIGINIWDNYLGGNYACGIPHTFGNGQDMSSDYSLFNGSKRMKMYAGNHYGFPSYDLGKTNSVKLNPAFSCFTVLKTGYETQEEPERIDIYSPFYVGNCSQNNKMFTFRQTSHDYIIRLTNDKMGKTLTRKAYMSARPRCCILNNDYQNAEKSFIKKYPQSEQQIRLYCKNIKLIDDYNIYCAPIFRMLITQK